MNCKSVKNWLMQAESLRHTTWPLDLVQHVDSCAACAKVARQLRELEDAWREQNIPAQAKKAKARFLKKLPTRDVPRSAPALRSRFFTVLPWLSAAAMFLVAVSLFAAMLRSQKDRPGPGPAPIDIDQHAAVEVVDRLVDWNLELSNASPEDRKRLLKESAPLLRQDLQKAKPLLTPEENEWAEDLLENGFWLALTEDPFEEANRAQVLAEKIFENSEAAKKNGNNKAAERCNIHYHKFLDRAVNPLFEKIAKMKPPEPPKNWKKDGKFDGKRDGKKGPFWNMTPPQFQQKQTEFRNAYEALRKKGGFRAPPGFGFKK